MWQFGNGEFFKRGENGEIGKRGVWKKWKRGVWKTGSSKNGKRGVEFGKHGDAEFGKQGVRKTENLELSLENREFEKQKTRSLEI